MSDARALEAAAWAAASGTATSEQLATLEADPRRWRDALEDLLEDTEDRLEAVRRLTGPERLQVVADFEGELARLEAAYDLLTKVGDSSSAVAAIAAADPAGEVRLQASWGGGNVVVWAAGPGTEPATAEELSDRLEAIGGPAVGWSPFPAVPLPSGARAAALAIPVGEALGWLVAVGGGLGREGVGASVAWLGRAAIAAVRLVARGAVVPTLPAHKRADGRGLDLAVHWVPALVPDAMLDQLTNAMPGPVTALPNTKQDARVVTLDVIGSVVDAVIHEAASRLELPAPPPHVHSPAQVAEAVVTRLDGSSFVAPMAAGAEISKRLDRWAKPVLGTFTTRLVLLLDPPDTGNAWFLSVLGPGAEGGLLPIEAAIADGKATKALVDELVRAERVVPALLRPGAMRRGQVYLSQDEAWELMTVTGRALEAAGFEVRVPALSRRKPAAGLRLFTEPTGDTVVGAHQLSNVRWSVLFDDVELTAADIARLAKQARPLVQSHGKWVELDASTSRRRPPRWPSGPTRPDDRRRDPPPLGGPRGHLGPGRWLRVDGTSWASDLLSSARRCPPTRSPSPRASWASCAAYQAEALAWLGFLDAAELGGCLALDMGLGKTPTMLAHLARTAGNGHRAGRRPTRGGGQLGRGGRQVHARPAVVVHHGASRAARPCEFGPDRRADVVITTYGTAVRDVEHAGGDLDLGPGGARRGAGHQEPGQRHGPAAASHPARSRIALTGTPIENGLGDLWAILDFTNPGLVGPRPAFIAQLSGEGEAALRALNGILVFRRTKSEPEVAAELPDRIDELDHCTMTPEQIGLYQAVLDSLVVDATKVGGEPKQGAILAAITALKQICNHPAAYQGRRAPRWPVARASSTGWRRSSSRSSPRARRC
jgi:hypothetical protein